MSDKVESNNSRMLLAVPGLAALGLGGIYALGALAYYGQFREAGLDAIQAMPLVPVNQLLGRGIGVATSQFFQAVVFIVLTAIVGAAIGLRQIRSEIQGSDHSSPGGEGENSDETNEGWWRRHLSWALIALLGLIVAVLLVAYSWRQCAVLFVGFVAEVVVIGLLVWRRLKEDANWNGFDVRVYAAGLLAFVTGAAIAGSFLTPSPLPETIVRTSSGKSVEGHLVMEDDSSYVVELPDSVLISLPAARVRSALTHYRSSPHEPTAVESLFR
jgi:hypothetical protein